jgi:RNA polymerase sigma-70 factor, ECF subfamily
LHLSSDFDSGNDLVPSAIVQGFRDGDPAAFLAVYDAYGGEVRGLVRRIFISPFDREEAVQEAWLQIHRVCGRFEPERGSLGGWLRTIALNRCKEILRARGRRPNARDDADDNDLRAPGAGPDDETSERRLNAAMAKFMQTLDPEQTRVFQLSLLEERGHDEVSREMGISSRRCKYLRFKLLQRAANDPGLAAALAEVTGS